MGTCTRRLGALLLMSCLFGCGEDRSPARAAARDAAPSAPAPSPAPIDAAAPLTAAQWHSSIEQLRDCDGPCPYRDLVDESWAALDPARRRALLVELGPALLRHEAPQVRSWTAIAVHEASDAPEVEALALAALADDRAEVRGPLAREIAESYVTKHAALRAALAARLPREPDERVRGHACRVVAEADREGARRALKLLTDGKTPAAVADGCLGGLLGLAARDDAALRQPFLDALTWLDRRPPGPELPTRMTIEQLRDAQVPEADADPAGHRARAWIPHLRIAQLARRLMTDPRTAPRARLGALLVLLDVGGRPDDAREAIAAIRASEPTVADQLDAELREWSAQPER